METSNIRVEENRLYQLFKQFSRESVLIILVSVCVITSLTAILVAVLALNSGAHAEVKIEYELPKMQDEIDKARTRNDIYFMYMQELYVELKNQGLDPPPLPENE